MYITFPIIKYSSFYIKEKEIILHVIHSQTNHACLDYKYSPFLALVILSALMNGFINNFIII